MKLICKQCGYSREELDQYENFGCCLCGAMMNQEKEEFFNSFKAPKIENETIGINEVVKTLAINSFKRDIKQIGAIKVWKVLEGFSSAATRANYRKFYYMAMDELKREG